MHFILIKFQFLWQILQKTKFMFLKGVKITQLTILLICNEFPGTFPECNRTNDIL
jgi:hypothetical protein